MTVTVAVLEGGADARRTLVAPAAPEHERRALTGVEGAAVASDRQGADGGAA